ncbi:MAG: hypothetical protein JW973_00725 [Bacteroidales bacterium]|nr:hypothetical protein [Bacteroidales bacterium]
MNLLNSHLVLLKAFQKFSVRYLIVGGYAVNIYGYLRATIDLDIWIDKDRDNLHRLIDAFVFVGYEKTDATNAIQSLLPHKNISLYDEDENKVDIIQLYSTVVSFNDAYNRRFELKTDNVYIHVIGYNDLLNTKIRAGRGKDWEDVRQLKAIDEIRRKGEKGEGK